jgi:CheY-like chemotaxis protein
MSDTAVILLVEDREDDIVIITKAFQLAGLTNPLHPVRDGEEAIAYLDGVGKYSNRAEHPLPILVLLDLKLPGIDGFEVLSWIRRQEGIRTLPVLVLTSSSEIRDINRAYHLGANSFFVKDFDFQNTVELGKLLRSYWLHTALPPETARPVPKRAY